MNTKQVDLLWIADPGHSWLRISLADFLELDISKDITEYSYITSAASVVRFVYLEEDCDAPVAIQKMKKLDWKMVVNNTHVDDFTTSFHYNRLVYFEV